MTPHYDPMMAKVIVHRPTREGARTALMEALRDFRIEGVKIEHPCAARGARQRGVYVGPAAYRTCGRGDCSKSLAETVLRMRPGLG